jgi:hypothetical protein
MATKKPGMIYSSPFSGKSELILKWAEARKINRSDIIVEKLNK